MEMPGAPLHPYLPLEGRDAAVSVPRLPQVHQLVVERRYGDAAPRALPRPHPFIRTPGTAYGSTSYSASNREVLCNLGSSTQASLHFFKTHIQLYY